MEGSRDDRTAERIAIAVLLWIVAAMTIYASSQIRSLGVANPHDPGPRFFPNVLAVALVAAGLFEVALAWVHRNNSRPGASSRGFLGLLPALLMLFSLAAYCALLNVVGFATATLLFCSGWMCWQGERFVRACLLTLVLVIFVEIVFRMVLKVQLPAGTVISIDQFLTIARLGWF